MLTLNFNQPQSELEAHRDLLSIHFKTNPPASVKKAMADIERLTGIKRSENRVRVFMQSLGMNRRKMGMVPAKADVEQQAAFKKELEPRLTEAAQDERTVFFVDPAHFVLAHFLGFLWSFNRLFIRAPSGPQRFNVLGALNDITHKWITVTNDSYINAESVCQLLEKIHALSLLAPITFHCRTV